MPNSINTLANLLHKFNSQTISRSLEYVSKIDLGSLQRSEIAQTTQLQADIKGTKKYHTQIAYHKASQRITQSDCTCPVGSFCKHGAAVAIGNLFLVYIASHKIRHKGQPFLVWSSSLHFLK